MPAAPSPAGRRTILLVSALADCIAGSLLLLVWVGFLPLDLSGMQVPRWTVGLLGAGLLFPGLALVTHQLIRPAGRD
jgi:hypothetical protein